MEATLAVAGSARRQLILRLLWDGELKAGEIAQAMPQVTFGAVSQHLGLLAQAGLVLRRSAGRERYYRVDRRALGPLASWLETMWDDALGELKLRAEAEESRRGPQPGARSGPRTRSKQRSQT